QPGARQGRSERAAGRSAHSRRSRCRRRRDGIVAMRFDILSLFPDLFESYLQQSLLKKAIDRGLVEVHRWNFRDWADGKHQSVDDRPYGGGPGMLLACQPVFDCVEAVQREGQPPGLVL